MIEARSYNTKCGIWTYFTADDGQIDLNASDYLLIGTLVSYRALRKYFGESLYCADLSGSGGRTASCSRS